jgi:hypothetical protein
MAIFKDGPDLHGKLLAASIALIEADPGSVAVHFVYALSAPAMRTNRTFRPYPSLDKGISGFFTEELG